MVDYYCPLRLGFHVSDWRYASSFNTTIEITGTWNNVETKHYLYEVDFPTINMTQTVWRDVPCELGGLKTVEVIANSDNSLQIDYLDYVHYEGRDYYGYGSQYFSYNFYYKSDDTCVDLCCISTEDEPLCDQIPSKVFNLYKVYDCDVDDDCPVETQSPTPAPTISETEEPDVYCENGIKGKDGVCCHSGCINSDGEEQCGGVGCSLLGLGYDYCCTANIIDNVRSCEEYSSPCINYQEKDISDTGDTGDTGDTNEDKSKNIWEWRWYYYVIMGVIFMLFNFLMLGLILYCRNRNNVSEDSEDIGEEEVGNNRNINNYDVEIQIEGN